MAPPKTRPSTPKNRFFHPYYIINVGLIFTYVLLRIQRLQAHGTDLGMPDIFGFTREMQIYFCLFLLLLSRLVSAPTIDAYLSSAFNFTRLSILICLWYFNIKLLIIFATLWILLFAVCPQPKLQLNKSLNINTLTPQTFETRIQTNTHQTIHILWCHAPWSSRSSQLTPILAALAKQFNHPRLVFSKIDVAKYPKIADTIGNLTTSPTSKQLPTFIAYKQGKELARIPVTDDKGRVPKQFARGFTSDDVINALDLESLHETAVKWEEEAVKRYQEKRTN